jgi:hypothetical protein
MFRNPSDMKKIYDLLLNNYKVFKDAYKYYASFYT